MGLFKKTERAVSVAKIPQPDPGTSTGYVYVDDWRVLVAYVTDSDTDKTIVVRFSGAWFHSCGAPNDEALDGHPLSKVGLTRYGVFTVQGSSLIQQLEKRNAGHPRHRCEIFADLKHWVLTFHDNTFECVARDISWHAEEGDPVDVLLRAATTDGLTGLLTHRAFPGARPLVPPEGTAAVAVDIAQMIWVNDYFGLPQGDRTLVRVAELVQECAGRIAGTAYRFSGEEFLVLLPGKSQEDARSLASQIVETVRSERLEYAAKDHDRNYVAVNTVVLNIKGTDLARVETLRDRLAELVYRESQKVGQRYDLVIVGE